MENQRKRRIEIVVLGVIQAVLTGIFLLVVFLFGSPFLKGEDGGYEGICVVILSWLMPARICGIWEVWRSPEGLRAPGALAWASFIAGAASLSACFLIPDHPVSANSNPHDDIVRIGYVVAAAIDAAVMWGLLSNANTRLVPIGAEDRKSNDYPLMCS